MANHTARAYRGRVFLLLMVVGLVGLAALAIPAFAHHGALSGHGGHAGVGHAAHGALGAGPSMARANAVTAPSSPRGAVQQFLPADMARANGWRFVPTPRAVFSVLALYGAFGNAGLHAFHLSFVSAALVAVLPALFIERVLMRPLWNLVFKLEAPACSPLTQLVLNEAEAVTPFRNGRGLISTVKDGRRVQLVASLRHGEDASSVRVGSRLLIEDVDAANERVTVSIARD